MKKLILPIVLLLTAMLFLPPKVNAQTNPDCQEVFDKESYKCLAESTACINSCVDKATSVMSLSVDGGKVNLECQRNTCDPAGKACDEQAQTNFKACIDARKTKADSPKEAEAKKETPKFTEFIEIVNKLSLETISVTFLDSSDLEQSKALVGQDIPQDIKELFEKFKPMTNEEFQRLWNSKPDNLTADEDKRVYKWGDESGAIMSASSWKDIKFKEPVKNNDTQEILRMVELDQGQLEVKLKEPDQKNKFGVQGDFFDLFVIQTHFWVSQSQDKKLAVIGVYEGEVEVNTRDGQIIKVKPDGGKPGVVVVSRQLSVFKLAIVGVILAVIVSGVVWLIKKKTSVKVLKKR